MQNLTSNLMHGRLRAAWIFLSPALIVLFATAGWPLLRTIYFSFTDAQLGAFESVAFIGFENYYNTEWGGLFADPYWWIAVVNTLRFSLISVSLETFSGLIVALFLHQKFFGRGFLRTAILIPWAIPTVVSAKMWNWMLHDQFGVLNDLLTRLGFINAPLAWTANPDLSLWAVIIVDVWKTTPFMALLILAGLQMLPTDCYESARMDGVNPIRTFFRVTLPLLKSTIVVAITFRLLDALRVFDLIYILTSNSRSTTSMAVYARQHLVDFQEIGYGSAASTLLFLIIGLITASHLVVARAKSA